MIEAKSAKSVAESRQERTTMEYGQIINTSELDERIAELESAAEELDVDLSRSGRISPRS